MPRILVIDDDVLILKSVRRLLEKKGYTIETAKSGEEGLQKLESESYDLVLCDVRMPRLDGIMTISKMKESAKEGKRSECPVVFMTGYASEEAPIDALKLGAKDYILKPFNIDELLESVKKHIHA
jgi:DNA-binding response OmpR family regulator